MSGWRVMAIIFLFIAAFPLSMYGVQAYEIHPSIDVNNFIVYADKNFTSVFPQVFTITYSVDDNKVFNWFYCFFCDASKYKYAVVNKTYYLEKKPTEIIEYNGARILLTYFVTVSVAPYATLSWFGTVLEEHAKISLSVFVYGRIDRPLLQGTFPLGRIIHDNINDNVIVKFFASIERTSPDQGYWNIADEYVLLLDETINLNFYRLTVKSVNPMITGTKSFGYEDKGVFIVAPYGNMNVEMCLQGNKGFSIAGEVSYSNMYSASDAKITLNSGSCSSTVINNIVFIPGNYTNRFTFKSGVISVNINTNAEIPGVLASLSKPIVLVAYSSNNNTWTARIYSLLTTYSYKTDSYIRALIEGKVSIQGITNDFTCNLLEVRNTKEQFHPYDCSIDLGKLNINDPYKVSDASAYIHAILIINEDAHTSQTYVNATIISLTSISGIISFIYSQFKNLTLIMILATLILYIINTISQQIAGKYMINPEIIDNAIMNIAFLTALFLGLPYIIRLTITALINVFSTDITLKQIISQQPLYSLITSSPEDTIASLMKYYDHIFNQIKEDQYMWIEAQLNQLTYSFYIIISSIIAAIALSIILIALLNSIAGGVIVETLTGILIMLTSFYIMLIPAIASIVLLTNLAQFIITLTAIFIFIFLIIGFIMTIFPTPLARIGTSLISAGILYITTIPITGFIAYTAYSYMKIQFMDFMNKLMTPNLESLSNIITPIILAQLNLAVPVLSIAIIIAYISMTATTTLIIILAHT
ncbi:MAG: hypothetical protein ACP5IZ_11335, partial [Thermoprotei archaeon]